MHFIDMFCNLRAELKSCTWGVEADINKVHYGSFTRSVMTTVNFVTIYVSVDINLKYEVKCLGYFRAIRVHGNSPFIVDSKN